MERAAQHGTTLIAGVLNDEDTSKYKRAPIMTHQERCNEVLGCKFVDEIIPNAPAFGLTKEFIKEHDIHIVCYGEEYDKPDDLYYKAARDLGIAQTLPRTGGISTSDLIKRIRSRTDESLEAKDAKK
jgi:glycerol-3-phosphate cytidylyltransferase-like family protein